MLQFKWRWYYWEIGLTAILLWFEIIVDPWGIFNYLGGLVNVPLSQEGLLISVAVIPAWVPCPLVLLVRMLIVWPRRFRGWPRLMTAWAVAATTFVVMCVLPFVLGTFNPAWAYMSGFKRHVQRRVDVPAVQAWLVTLDPNIPAGHGGSSEIPIREADLPRSLRRLRPWGMRVTSDDERRPMIRCSWGSGIMRPWGLVIGHRDMRTPPSDLSRFGEYRDEVQEGVYVWKEIY